MKNVYEPDLTKKMLDEYFCKIEMRKNLQEEITTMSKFIKNEMAKAKRSEIHLYGYFIDVETKFEPNADFFRLMYTFRLEHLLTPSINGNHLKSAKRKMGILDDDYYKNYTKEKETKWLHVTKD